MPLYALFAVLFIFITWRYGDWRKWKLYYPTMLFFAVGNLLYNFLFYNKPLWMHKSPYLPHTLLEMIWIFVIFPCTLLFYLPHYPKKFINQIFYIAPWALGYAFLEWIFYRLDYFTYLNGWNIWCSLLFDCFMFTILKLHYVKPLWAWLLSGTGLIIVMKIFNVSIKIMR